VLSLTGKLLDNTSGVAYRRTRERQTFHCRLLEQTEAATLQPFDLVMGSGMLHHLDESTARQFMTLGWAALEPGGRVLTLDPCCALGQNPVTRFLISKDRGQHVRDEAGYRALAEGLFTAIAGALTHQASPHTGPWSAAYEGNYSPFSQEVPVRGSIHLALPSRPLVTAT